MRCYSRSTLDDVITSPSTSSFAWDSLSPLATHEHKDTTSSDDVRNDGSEVLRF